MRTRLTTALSFLFIGCTVSTDDGTTSDVMDDTTTDSSMNTAVTGSPSGSSTSVSDSQPACPAGAPSIDRLGAFEAQRSEIEGEVDVDTLPWLSTGSDLVFSYSSGQGGAHIEVTAILSNVVQSLMSWGGSLTIGDNVLFEAEVGVFTLLAEYDDEDCSGWLTGNSEIPSASGIAEPDFCTALGEEAVLEIWAANDGEDESTRTMSTTNVIVRPPPTFDPAVQCAGSGS